jgi:pimeloyl-ACP methyl ester carboxylesterase
MGTLVALAMALSQPDQVRKLVLLSGYYYPTMRVDALLTAPVALPIVGDALRYTVTALAARATLTGVVKGMFAPLDVPPGFFDVMPREMMLRPSQIRANAEDAAFLMPAAAGLATRCSGLRMPVTIMAGAADAVVDPQAHSVRLHDDVPHSELAILPGIGHMLHHAASQEIVAALVERAVNDPRDESESAAVAIPG